jgi:antirestriction protein ArdC
MPSQNDIRQSITNQIVSALESGSVPPWRRPWRLGSNAGAAANIVSRRLYRGLNPILLDLASQTHEFTSKWWATYRQWRQMGGRVMARPSHVPPGKWGTQIVYWSPITKKVENESGDLEDDRFFVLRLYMVFNVDQVEGDHLDHLRAGQPDTGEPLVIDYQPAEDAVAATGADIRFGGGKAFYSRLGDYIQVPPKATFESVNQFYATVLHELCHWGEHEARLNWSRKDKENTYQLGELVAEIGSCYLCRELGVPATDDLTNHVAYLMSWLQAMKSDPRFIFVASAQASKAADFILSFSRTSEDVPEPEDELVTA